MGDEFKYLVNPTRVAHSFQHNGHEYVVPPLSKRLLLAEVADHGEKRSYRLTDPTFDGEGALVSAGNAIVKTCHTTPADVVSQVEVSEPILVQNSPDSVEDLVKENQVIGKEKNSGVVMKPLQPRRNFAKAPIKEAKDAEPASGVDSL